MVLRLTNSILFISLLVAIISLLNVIFDTDMNITFAWYYFIQIILIFTIWALNWSRKTGQIGILPIKELPDNLYAIYSLMFFFATTALYRSLFINEVNLNFVFDSLLFIALAIFLATQYQQRFWTLQDAQNRRDVITKFIIRANLTEIEEQAVTLYFITQEKKQTKTSLLWRVFSWFLVVIIIGATLNTYASDIADKLQEIIPLRDALPPYR